MNENNVDVKKITEEIKKEITEKGLVNDIPSFDEVIIGKNGAMTVDLAKIKGELNYLKSHEIHYYRDITSYHKLIAPVVIFIKRVIRKLCKFLGEPMADEINEYHQHLTKAIEQTVKTMEQSFASNDKQTQLLEIHKYRLLVEQYAATNYRLEKEMDMVKWQMKRIIEQVDMLNTQRKETASK